jgi:phosphotriesterase-related protein
MTHEHLLIDFTCMFKPPPEASELARAHEPLAMQNLGWVRYNYLSNRDNLLLVDEDTAIAEALLYKRAGGGAIVDATTYGIGRDPRALARIARATGLNVIMGAGFYVDAVHPNGMDTLSDADLARQIAGEITSGVGNSGVKAGVIGEIGCTWPLTQNERKVLRAAARAQRETGAPILIHPGRNEAAPLEILEVLAEAGADVGRTIMGHLDRTVADFGALLDVARSGCYLEYDLFGQESSYYPLSDFDMLSDAQRLGYLKRLVAEGYGDKLLVAHDICTKHRLVRYGGHGFSHILDNIVPRMRRKGFSEEDIHAITVANPARILAFA